MPQWLTLASGATLAIGWMFRATRLGLVIRSVGENPHAVERIWDKMYRTSIHGRKGGTMLAISAVDLALWDIKGKLLGAPVYELLGGTPRPFPVYGRGGVEPGDEAARDDRYRDQRRECRCASIPRVYPGAAKAVQQRLRAPEHQRLFPFPASGNPYPASDRTD